MPRTYSKPRGPRYRPKSEAEKQHHREEIESAGGWYSHKQQREERERRQREAQAQDRNKIVTYRQREYIQPAQITREGE